MADYYESEIYDKEKLAKGNPQANSGLGKRDIPPLVTRLENRFDKGWKPVGIRPVDRAMVRYEAEDFLDKNNYKKVK